MENYLIQSLKELTASIGAFKSAIVEFNIPVVIPPRLQNAYNKALEQIANTTYATPERIETARSLHQTDEIEIDDDALLSAVCQGEDSGFWVSAWVWVSEADD